MYRTLVLAIMLVALQAACSVKRFAIGKLGDALAGGGATYASDDDLELIRDAVPFSLKLIESLLAESPKHRGLLLAAASGFTQYGYAFVQQEADELEAKDVAAAAARRGRTRRLCLRARGYGLRGLELKRPGFAAELRKEPKQAVAGMRKEDVPFLYWTATAWGAAISAGKDDPALVGEQPLVEALIDRAAELDPDWDHGAIHGFLIAYEASRVGTKGDSAERSRKHFERALALTEGQMVSPLVSMAETVSVAKQNRKEFEALLQRALAIDVNAKPEWRLANLVYQRRARWLLGRVEELFVE